MLDCDNHAQDVVMLLCHHQWWSTDVHSAHLGRAASKLQVVPMCQFNGPQLGVLVPFHLVQPCYLQRHPINWLKWHRVQLEVGG